MCYTLSSCKLRTLVRAYYDRIRLRDQTPLDRALCTTTRDTPRERAHTHTSLFRHPTSLTALSLSLTHTHTRSVLSCPQSNRRCFLGVPLSFATLPRLQASLAQAKTRGDASGQTARQARRPTRLARGQAAARLRRPSPCPAPPRFAPRC